MSLSITLKFTTTVGNVADGSSYPVTMKELIEHVRDSVIDERCNKDLFYKDTTVRPGILVIINESDWEVEDGPDYKLQDGDVIEFISTLHGG
ncbi:hypothetical protein BX661DRAFT_184555 [Kickxella alabastrina]|uniref:uncharacterized protein n=1 Tax=Kickxella alabastrina TaxID=61397 RepID=UPI002220FA63|nr:uncharacterized protein BX661DRAFT_184555 [Kickxella alabastrina]KAI7825440.1 hypothetical protein BX661DRAFT_184555 [Kickxella alabastrina]